MTTFRYTIQLSDGVREVIIPALEVQSASGALSTGRQIQSVTPGTGGAGQFVLSGDVTFPVGSPTGPGIRFQVGDTFEVSNVNTNDPNIGTFTVTAVLTPTGSPVSSVTTITVAEDVLTPSLGSPLGLIPLGVIRYATPDNGSPQVRTSLELAGRGVQNYGEHLNTNLLHMLENFGSATPPNSPIDGQIWFDSASRMINIFNSTGSPQWVQLISQQDATDQFVDITGDTMTGALTLGGNLDVNGWNISTLLPGGNVDIVGAAGVGAMLGGSVNVYAGVSVDSSFQSGGVQLVSANGPATGLAGSIDIITGNGGLNGGNLYVSTGSSTENYGSGGHVYFNLGNGTGVPYGYGGDFKVYAGNSNGTGYYGGQVYFNGGDGVYGGKIDLFAGEGTVGGGVIDITGGRGNGSSGGGRVRISGGPSLDDTGLKGGNVELYGGSVSATDNDGGDVLLKPSSGGAGKLGNGGNILLTIGKRGTSAGSPSPVDGYVLIAGASTGQPNVQVRFNEVSGQDYVALQGPDAVTTSRVWTLPQDDPAVVAGQFLVTDASGVLSFATPGGSPEYLHNIVEDPTPQLGADLDVNGFNITNTGTGFPARNIHISGTSENVVGGASGYVRLYGGDNTNTAAYSAGGRITLDGGDATGASGNTKGGNIQIRSGHATASADGVGGIVEISSGNGGAGGGNIDILAGYSTAIGDGGEIRIRPGKVGPGSPTGLRGFVEFSWDSSGPAQTESVSVHFEEANGTEFIALKAPDTVTTRRTWTLPEDDPAIVAGSALTTDAAGVQSFTYLPGFEQQVVATGSPPAFPGSPPVPKTVFDAANISWTYPEPANKQSVQVFLDGVKQQVDLEYTVTDSNTITFINGQESSDPTSIIELVSFG